MKSKLRGDEEIWELWVQDRFDWDTPRKVEIRGKDLKKGLCTLWQYHLRESITPEGHQGFSKFNLWLPSLRSSHEISGELSSQVKIRDWAFGFGERLPDPSGENHDLLELLGKAHYCLIASRQNEQEILKIAEASKDQFDFSRHLSKLIDFSLDKMQEKFS